MGIIRIAKRCTSAAVLVALFGCASSSNAVTLPSSAPDGVQGSIAPTFHVFTVGKTPGLPITAVPRDIVAGPNGTMWFTDLNTPAIGTISTGLKIREFTTGLGTGAEPYSIVAGPDGNLWFSDGAGAIGRVTPSGKNYRVSFAADGFREPRRPHRRCGWSDLVDRRRNLAIVSFPRHHRWEDFVVSNIPRTNSGWFRRCRFKGEPLVFSPRV